MGSMLAPRRVVVVVGWLLGSGLWALLLLRHLSRRWPHTIKAPGFGDLFQRLHETGILVHGGDPYVIGARISDNVPPSVSLLHLPLYLSGHMGAAFEATWLSVASMAVICAVLVTTVRPMPRRWALLGATLVAPPVFGLCFYPSVAALVAGQDQLWFMALVMVDLFAISRWRRGVLVGAVAGFSLWPAIFALPVLLSAGLRSIRRLVTGFMITIVAGAILSIGESWRYWTYLVPSGQVTSRGVNSSATWPGHAFGLIENYSLNGIISRPPLGGALASRLVYVVLFLVVVGAGVAISWALWRADLPVTAVAMLSIAAVESTPFAWDHHWVWVLLMLPFAALECWGPHRVLSVLLWLSLLPFERQLSARVGAHFSPKAHGQPILRNWFNVVFLNRYQLTGLVLLGAAGVVVLLAARRRATPATERASA
jgi:alpha-1,2-mannosyltransferase